MIEFILIFRYYVYLSIYTPINDGSRVVVSFKQSLLKQRKKKDLNYLIQ